MGIRRFILSIVIFITPAIVAAAEENVIHITPEPTSIEYLKGSFMAAGAPINCDASFDDDCLTAIRIFANSLSIASGRLSSFATSVGLAPAASNGRVKGFVFLNDPSLGEEEYYINTGPKSAIVSVSGFNGLVYAIQTLKQMLPEAIYSDIPSPESYWRLPCSIIKDKPGAAYRGVMLDCSRHFFKTHEIKQLLDEMAKHKFNCFRWHLTDDQGWRLDIMKYPELTLIGGYRSGTVTEDGHSDGIRYGGYYTREDVEDIVRYASGLGITVIPDICFIGHTQAALAAMPQLGCTGQTFNVAEDWSASAHGLCPGKQETIVFIQNVLEEVAGLFPSGYIHIGGDKEDIPLEEWSECSDCQAVIARMGLKDGPDASAEEQLATRLLSEIESFLDSRGRKMLTWHNIPDSEILFWSEHLDSGPALIEAMSILPQAGDGLWRGQYQQTLTKSK